MLLAAKNKQYQLEKRRLPGRRPRVTFIVGIKCNNGLVLASDSQEGDGYTKKHVYKLERFDAHQWGVCWGGAGDARMVDKFSDKFKQSLEGAPKYDRNDIEAIAETCLQFVHKKYSAKSGSIEIIMGCFGGIAEADLRWHLYKGDSRTACLGLQKSYCCAGTGDNSLANFVLRNIELVTGSVTYLRVSQAKKLAILIVSLMKEYADGVGGPTNIWEFTNPVVQWLPTLQHQVEDIEKNFPVSEIETKLTAYWIEKQNFREYADEVNKEEIEKLRKERNKKSPD
jgi:20S proteasome alpha/beta subunit